MLVQPPLFLFHPSVALGMAACATCPRQLHRLTLSHAVFAPTRREDWKPTIKGVEGFDADADAQALRKAIKGWGTDEKTLIRILGTRTQSQRTAIRGAYNRLFQRDLERDVDHDTGGNFSRTLLALVRTPEERDAHFLKHSIKGLGTDDVQLQEILCTKTSAYLAKVKAAYESATVNAGHVLIDGTA